VSAVFDRAVFNPGRCFIGRYEVKSAIVSGSTYGVRRGRLEDYVTKKSPASGLGMRIGILCPENNRRKLPGKRAVGESGEKSIWYTDYQ